jgi:hypothetical protein
MRCKASQRDEELEGGSHKLEVTVRTQVYCLLSRRRLNILEPSTLDTSYEKVRFIFDHRLSRGRVSHLLPRSKEGSARNRAVAIAFKRNCSFADTIEGKFEGN